MRMRKLSFTGNCDSGTNNVYCVSVDASVPLSPNAINEDGFGVLFSFVVINL